VPGPQSDGTTPRTGGQRLSRAELADARGADPADLDRVARFAADHGLQVLERSAGGTG
jgi:hypothetical protein